MYYTHDDHSSSVCSPSRSCCSTQGAWKWYYIPPHDIESIRTRRRCGQQALVFRRCNNTIEFRYRDFKILLAPHSNITVSVFTTPLGSEHRVQNHHARRELLRLPSRIQITDSMFLFISKLQKGNNLQTHLCILVRISTRTRDPLLKNAMALAQFDTQDQDQGSNRRGKERREVQVLLCYQDHGLVDEKTNSRDTRERTPVGGGCLTGET